ncbi:peptidoglycan DD-metalloendopeptidase family protein [Aromatoleum petrolei]|uniref:Peptidoglycan DD-metalloendopeptidase family protein n=1 Tax=Aromatoleum petrolei TaxID=76116 RepID=A0ABX1MRB6_9RHOO|nr:peptidoglycan DD-metalloendopeptidase family protein [Aromatoleum petrolei]NMF90527.1 peptidoglycan DD-metalloendopeptidase family protein [Aromatoleum petrolei]QTQ35656.1 Putative peptidase [Aromatoleum petrolei]
MSDSVKFGHVRRWLTLCGLVAVLVGCAAPRPAPVRDGTPPPPGAEAAAGTVSKTEAPTHVVRPGDTLLGIARQYGVTVKDLVGWNGLADPNQIHVGQALRVGAAPAATPAAAAGAVSGAIAQPIAITQPVDVQPVKTPGDAVPAAGGFKQEPRGGKQPYSDEAWASLNPRAITPAAPVPAAPEPDKATGNTSWLWPASGQVIETFDESTNKGVDIAGKAGDPVVASAGGKVVYSGSGLRGYGKLVIIKHDANYLTAYAHNQQLLVKEGDSVSKGQKIAELGSTDTDRPKVHFEIRKQGRPVDPLKYLPAR